jgi:hypothetical protein
MIRVWHNNLGLGVAKLEIFFYLIKNSGRLPFKIDFFHQFEMDE